jgi:GntR family transcriptional repressor for pyruvate dehydrogenase complex
MGNAEHVFRSLELRRERLHEQIAQNIEEMIASDQLRPGDQLPTERELAKLLGVNRATVREGIRLLQQRGLVDMKVGSGTFVTNVPLSVVADSIERYLNHSSCTHEDLVALREILEPETAALAAVHATPEELARLSDLVQRVEETFAAMDVKNNAAADADFHQALAQATHNELIVAITAGLKKPMRDWLEAQGLAHRLEGGSRSHRTVCEAVAARDPQRARAAMNTHNQFTRSTLRAAQKPTRK